MSNGVTALMWGVRNNRLAISQLLLQHPDIDVNTQSGNGNTALLATIHNNQVRNQSISLNTLLCTFISMSFTYFLLSKCITPPFSRI